MKLSLIIRTVLVITLAVIAGVILFGCTGPLISSNIDIDANGNTLPITP